MQAHLAVQTPTMCGIAGILSEKIAPQKLKENVNEMIGELTHRGPESLRAWTNCVVGLAHSRLKIVDLSDEANQPFSMENCVITYNGEIFNYPELRKELMRDGFVFKTYSDTEMILAAYLRWGFNCVKHFVGMWAFAIWDEASRLLFCSRDRFGIKPFYYIWNTSAFYFASEFKALKRIPGFNHELNLPQVNRGLLLGWTGFQDETYYTNIRSLLPAHNIIIRGKSLVTERYWYMKPENSTELSSEEKEERFRELFRESMIIHSRSDVPVGACLSGGLDSSSIVSMYAHLFPHSALKTFTIYYTGYHDVDERPFAAEVIKKSGSIQPFFYSPDEEEAAENFSHAAEVSEVPISNSSHLSQYFVMKQASLHGIKVILDGQGADEYLGGYMHSFSRLAAKYFSSFQPLQALQILRNHRQLHQLSGREMLSVIMKSFFVLMYEESDVLKYEYSRQLRMVQGKFATDFSITLNRVFPCKLNNFLYHLLFTTSLPTLLHYEDRNSMAFSIEARVPFLDHRLVEWMMNLPAGDKISHHAESKYLLRRSLKNILPEKISARHDKKAFITPGETTWLRTSLRHLLEDDFSSLYWLRQSEIKKLIENYNRGSNRHAKLVWRLATLNYWMKNIYSRAS